MLAITEISMNTFGKSRKSRSAFESFLNILIPHSFRFGTNVSNLSEWGIT